MHDYHWQEISFKIRELSFIRFSWPWEKETVTVLPPQLSTFLLPHPLHHHHKIFFQPSFSFLFLLIRRFLSPV